MTLKVPSDSSAVEVKSPFRVPCSPRTFVMLACSPVSARQSKCLQTKSREFLPSRHGSRRVWHQSEQSHQAAGLLPDPAVQYCQQGIACLQDTPTRSFDAAHRLRTHTARSRVIEKLHLLDERHMIRLSLPHDARILLAQQSVYQLATHFTRLSFHPRCHLFR